MMEEVILSLDGEGEKVAVVGERSDRGWRFRVKREPSASVEQAAGAGAVKSVNLTEADRAENAAQADPSDRDRRAVSDDPSRPHDPLRDVLQSLRPSDLALRPTEVHPLFARPIWDWLTSVSPNARPSDRDAWERLLHRDNPVYRAAVLIREARSMVLITGAGMSVDSGVNDFRSASGWWRKIDPRTVATVEALESDYDLFHEFYAMRIAQLQQVVPHRGHAILAEWERRGKLACICTQNVDRLHQIAGNRNVYELHGTIRRFRCHACGAPHTEAAFLQKQSCACGGRLRPDVVLFGESLPSEAWRQSLSAIRQADLVLVIGTSLQVAPVNQLPFLTRGRLIFINAEETGYEEQFDVFIKGRALDSLTAIAEWLDGCG
jgi:NAD-dependent deacetylase